jgi:hypothetical protein
MEPFSKINDVKKRSRIRKVGHLFSKFLNKYAVGSGLDITSKTLTKKLNCKY